MSTVHLRSFARTFTERIGVLDQSWLGRGRQLGEARVLWEIGAADPDPVDVADLRRRLGLDSGYASRLLRSLESDGLVELAPHPDDGRARVVSLTRAGRAEWCVLEDRSEARASSLIAELDERRRAELDEILGRAERLLLAADAEFEVVDPRSGAAIDAVGSYFAELDERFASGFDPGDAATADAPSFESPIGAFVLVRCGHDVAGCGALQRLGNTVGEIKRMWIAPSWRGLGLAGRLLAHLEQRALDAGHTTVRLDTNGVLTEAIAMYERAGYRSIERYNDNPYAERWFEKSLV